MGEAWLKGAGGAERAWGAGVERETHTEPALSALPRHGGPQFNLRDPGHEALSSKTKGWLRVEGAWRQPRQEPGWTTGFLETQDGQRRKHLSKARGISSSTRGNAQCPFWFESLSVTVDIQNDSYSH